MAELGPGLRRDDKKGALHSIVRARLSTSLVQDGTVIH